MISLVLAIVAVAILSVVFRVSGRKFGWQLFYPLAFFIAALFVVPIILTVLGYLLAGDGPLN